MGEEVCRKTRGEESWRRNRGGIMMETAKVAGERIVAEESWMRNHGGGNKEEESWRRKQ